MNRSKLFKVSIGFSLLMGVASISQAAVMTSFEDADILFSQVAGTSTIDFEGSTDCPVGYTSCNGAYEVRKSDGTVNGSAPPFKATPVGQNWLTVPNPQTNGSAVFKLDASYDYFGLFWGSIDTYNSIEFFDGMTSLATFSGGDFKSPLQADGGQGDWNSNRFINFLFTDGMSYNSVKLISNGLAFETDNHAYGNVVPEPSILALFGIGIAGIGFARRRKNRV